MKIKVSYQFSVWLLGKVKQMVNKINNVAHDYFGKKKVRR